MVICSEDEGTSSEVLACDMMSKAMDTEVLCDRLQRVFRLDNEFQSGEYRLIGCCGNLVDNRHSMPLWEIFMIMVESKSWCACDFWWEHNRKIRLPNHIVTFAFLLQIFAHFCDKILCNSLDRVYNSPRFSFLMTSEWRRREENQSKWSCFPLSGRNLGGTVLDSLEPQESLSFLWVLFVLWKKSLSASS